MDNNHRKRIKNVKTTYDSIDYIRVKGHTHSPLIRLFVVCFCVWTFSGSSGITALTLTVVGCVHSVKRQTNNMLAGHRWLVDLIFA